MGEDLLELFELDRVRTVRLLPSEDPPRYPQPPSNRHYLRALFAVLSGGGLFALVVYAIVRLT